MEATEARKLVGRRRPSNGGHTPPAQEHTHEHEHDHKPSAPAKAEAPRTRTVRPQEERTHFTFSIELPLEWQGALKRHSIDEQEDGTFVAGTRESDVYALLRHVVKEYCEGIVRASAARRAAR